jgi:hypothetical protein
MDLIVRWLFQQHYSSLSYPYTKAVQGNVVQTMEPSITIIHSFLIERRLFGRLSFGKKLKATKIGKLKFSDGRHWQLEASDQGLAADLAKKLAQQFSVEVALTESNREAR